MDEDYYQLLGVTRSATSDDIQKAYRKMAHKYHPDVNESPDAQDKFQQIQKAYDVLNDPDKRELYNRYGSSFENMGDGPFRPGGGGGAEVDFSQMFGQGGGPQGMGGFEDLFRQFAPGSQGGSPFGGQDPRTAHRAQRPQRGRDIEHELSTTFQTAVRGGEAHISMQRAGESETLTVKIPAGIEDGKKIRLRGQGQKSPNGGQPGDLLIRVRVSSHPYFVRNGRNLELKLPISLREAVLGAKVDVPTPQGVITLTVPPAASSGKRLRVKGHGVAPDSDSPGDLFVELQIVLPANAADLASEAGQFLTDIDTATADPRKEYRW